MYFVIFGTDKPDVTQQRHDTLGDVASYVKDQSNHPTAIAHFAGPTLDEGGTINGTLTIIEAPSLDAARDFLANHPLQQLGLLEDVCIRQWDWRVGCPD